MAEWYTTFICPACNQKNKYWNDDPYICKECGWSPLAYKKSLKKIYKNKTNKKLFKSIKQEIDVFVIDNYNFLSRYTFPKTKSRYKFLEELLQFIYFVRDIKKIHQDFLNSCIENKVLSKSRINYFCKLNRSIKEFNYILEKITKVFKPLKQRIENIVTANDQFTNVEYDIRRLIINTSFFKQKLLYIPKNLISKQYLKKLQTHSNKVNLLMHKKIKSFKSFFADTPANALYEAKKECGEDAIFISTKKIMGFHISGKDIWEVIVVQKL